MRPAWISALLCLSLFAGQTVARPAFYWNATQGSYLTLDYLSFADADFEQYPGSDVGGQRQVLAAQYEFNQPWVIGLGYEYDSLDFSTAPALRPQANGDMHTLALAAQWRTALKAGELRLALAPAVSSSSNMLQHLGEFDSDSLQLWGAAVYTLPAGALNWVAGLASDHRFGEQRLYPVAGAEWRDRRWLVRLVYPDLLLQRQLGRNWQLAFTTSPDGNQWLAFDGELDQREDFRRKAWHSELRLSYQVLRSLDLGLSLGYNWNQRWEFVTVDGAGRQVDGDDASYIGLHLRWQFKPPSR